MLYHNNFLNTFRRLRKTANINLLFKLGKTNFKHSKAHSKFSVIFVVLSIFLSRLFSNKKKCQLRLFLFSITFEANNPKSRHDIVFIFFKCHRLTRIKTTTHFIFCYSKICVNKLYITFTFFCFDFKFSKSLHKFMYSEVSTI